MSTIDTGTLPRTITDGEGETLTFLEVIDEPEGPTLRVRAEVAPGAGPALHVHFRQEEALTVTEGRLGYQFQGDEEHIADPGETVVFPAGRPHRFWGASDEPTRCDGYIRPPENVAWFLTEIYRSTSESGKGRPDDFDAAFLLGRYRHEYAMPEIPAPVQRFVFPVLRLVGRLTGRFRRFEGAPDPMPPA